MLAFELVKDRSTRTPDPEATKALTAGGVGERTGAVIVWGVQQRDSRPGAADSHGCDYR